MRELADWLAGRGIEHLYLAGCGDSAFAGLAATLAFRRHSRLRVHAVHALDFARYDVRYLPPASALLALSYSGKVGRTVEAARQATSFGIPVIALTGDVSGQLASAADRVLPIDVPTLGFSPGTSTYVGMLCTLIELARRTPRAGSDHAMRDACEQLASQAAKTLDWYDDAAADIAGRLASGRFVTFLGAGPNEATARFGAAKLFEASQQIAVATNVEEWAHEEYFITRPDDPVVVIAPAGAARDRAWEILSELEFIRADATVVSDADLVLTKLQIVEINTKDLVDAAQLLRNHQLGRGDEAGRDELSLDRLCAVTSADWGWYTTLSDNLAKLAAFAQDALAEPDRAAVTGRAQAIQQAIDEPSKSLRWKARAWIGRHAPWYELPEEVAGTRNG